jgi:exopolysaccharide biosynthesis protein
VGITDDGGLVLVCVDGRSENTVGATYADLLQVFLDLDVPIRTVLNLDGGHSTILMGKTAEGEMKILNSPSSGLSELRPVADILTLVKR